MKGYKAFNEDLTCRGFQYEIGKEYTFDGEPIPCKQGFHFCATIADCYEYYPKSEQTRICEVEATGDIEAEEPKYCTNKIRIVAEVTEEYLRKANTNKSSSGYCNSGYCNSGDWNSGYCNSGDWNSGNRNSGVFCTDEKPTIKLFDKPSDWTREKWRDSNACYVMRGCPYTHSDFIDSCNMSDEEKERHPEYKTIGGYVKTFIVTNEDKQAWWNGLQDEGRAEVMALPNFDAEKFEKCTGIRVEG